MSGTGFVGKAINEQRTLINAPHYNSQAPPKKEGRVNSVVAYQWPGLPLPPIGGNIGRHPGNITLPPSYSQSFMGYERGLSQGRGVYHYPNGNGSIPPYPGADGALPYLYPGTSQQTLHFPPGHPAWVSGAAHWGAATAGYYPSAAIRPTPHSVGKPSPGGDVQPSDAQRMQQQQQYYQQQQQMARAMQHQAAWEARNSTSSTAPMPASSTGGHHDDAGQRQQESVATRETGDESQGGVGEARPASRRQAPTPAAYSSATAPTPPLMYSAATQATNVMGQPPPATSAPNQFYQPAPNVYAMRPASSIQQGQPSQPLAAPARQPFGNNAAKAPPYGHPQYPSGTDPHPGGGGVAAYSQYAPHAHTAWPQYQHTAQRPFAPTEEMTSHHAMMLQRMQPPQVASSQQIQQQWEIQRRAQGAGQYSGTAPTVQTPIASTSMSTTPGIPPIPAHPQSHLPSPGSHQARGRGGHAHQHTVTATIHSTPPMRPSQPPPHLASYPPDSIEAMALSPMVLKKKRPKVFSRDLTMVSSRRIMMALRSGQLLDTTWALNTLNVMLYDDSSAGSFNLNNMPDLLNIIIEHFAAMLSVLYLGDFKKCSPTTNKETTSQRIKQEQLDDGVGESDPHPTIVKPPIGRASSSKRAPNFTRTSRTGRLVKEEPTEGLPAELKKFMADANNQDDFENSRAENANLDFGFSKRIEDSLLTWIRQRQKCKGPTFNGWVEKRKERDGDVVDLLVAATGGAEGNSDEMATPSTPKHRHVGAGEKWDKHATPDFSLVARMVAVVSRDEGVVELTDRCLALSNILRGFSFIIGNERPLARHPALLPMIAKLLKLYVREAESEQSSYKRTQKEAEGGSSGSEGKFHFLSKLSSDPGAKPDCPPEEDSERKLLLETANHLRDDAFVLLSHISVQRHWTLQQDLFEVDSSVTYSILDALLYWATSTSLAARDSLQPAGVISPRNYSLEILCKMSVIERNIDLLVSTGPWPRVEQLVLVLCNMINLGEELPQREFAIVILNAVCGASEAACHVAAKQSDLLGHLVSFLESADMAMHQIVQHQGMHALKDNPELMGTSVGMLRRASSIMLHIARLESCRDCFCKLQNRLLQFTVSHFMDSRVAAAVSEILFEMQKGEESRDGKESVARQAEQIAAPRASSSLALSPGVREDDASQLSTATATMEAVINEGMTMASKNGDDQAETREAIHQGTSAYALMNGHGRDVPFSKERKTRKRPNNSPLNNGVAAADNGTHDCHTNLAETLYESGESIAKRASHEAVKEKLRNNLIQKYHEGGGNVDGLQAEIPNGLVLPGGADIANEEQKINGAH